MSRLLFLTALLMALTCPPGIHAEEAPASIALPAPALKGSVSVEETMAQRRSVRAYAPDPLSLQQVSQLLWAAQGITEPQKGLRTAPSAVESYPLRLYLFAGNVAGLPAGVYRYVAQGHKLEPAVAGDQRANAGRLPAMRAAPAFILYVVDTSVLAQRFGARADRYAAIEVGHSAQNVLLQEVALGLAGVGATAADVAKVKALLKLGESEEAVYVVTAGRKP